MQTVRLPCPRVVPDYTRLLRRSPFVGGVTEVKSKYCQITAPPCKDGYELHDMDYPILNIRYRISEMKGG